jgi:L-ectoine synthase
MIVRTLDSVTGTDFDVIAHNSLWRSRRICTNADGMGFSVSETVIEEGAKLHLHYKHHLEGVYCISGHGVLMSVDDGKKYNIVPGTIYLLNNHDKHTLSACSAMRLLCIFSPALSGRETHDESGSYPELLE